MNVPSPRTLGVVVFLLALVSVGAFIWSRAAGVSRASQDFPDGIAMVCIDAACAEGFTLSVRDVARIREANQDAPVPCPVCGGPSERARVCEACGRSSPARRGEAGAPLECPHCGRDLPGAHGGE